MSGLDIEGVLADAITDYLGSYTLPANYARPYVAHETHRVVAKRCGPLIAGHVAAVLREQIADWLLGDEAYREVAFRSILNEGAAWTALRTLAALVACVDPSRSESGSTDPEVRQSADRTSSPSRVPGEET